MNKISIAIAAAVMSLTACGGSNPDTQYVVNADVQDAITTGTNAQCPGAVVGRVVITTDLKSDMILSIYEESDGTAYAEFGGLVLSGKKTGDAYSLNDSYSFEDTHAAPNTSRDFVTSDVYTLNFTKNGSFVTGSITHEHHESCAGNGCGTQESQTIDCLTSTNLRGEKLPDDGAIAGLPEPGNKGSPTP
jgi:hypothetical protein